MAGQPAPIMAVTSDSREVADGGLFVAVPGFDTDGHEYISLALQAGAAAILVQEDKRLIWEPMVEKAGAVVVSVPDTRAALAQAAACGELPGADPERDTEVLYQLAMGWMQQKILARARPSHADVEHVVRFALRGLRAEEAERGA